MSMLEIFKMPKPMGITGRTSSITNAFVNAIIPAIYPTELEIKKSLDILNLNPDDLRCAYCGGIATEWDHLRPIVSNKMPTGYLSEIKNLVPACGKCNQSKGNKYWKDWINSNASLSPKSRGVSGLEKKIKRLESYERWGSVKTVDYEAFVGSDLWNLHWANCKKMHNDMVDAQAHAKLLKKKIMEKFAQREKNE